MIQIPRFSADGKWSETTHPTEYGGDYNQSLKDAGYEPWHSWGSETQASIEVYRRDTDDKHFLCLNTPCFFTEVLCDNTVAFLEFMRLYGTMWVELAFKQDVSDLMDELRRLLLDGQCGVFRDEVRMVDRRRAELREFYKRKKNTGT